HPRLARLLLRGMELGMADTAALFAALLSERDIFRLGPGEVPRLCESDLLERCEALAAGKRSGDGRLLDGTVKAVQRSAAQLLRLTANAATGSVVHRAALVDVGDAARLLLAACPDRVARQREEGGDRYLLANGRGAKLSPKSGVRNRPFLVAVLVDAREGGEGFIHQASALTPELIRSECGGAIATERKVVWEQAQERVMAWEEERLGAVVLSRRQVPASDHETIPVLLEVVRASGMENLGWEKPVRQFQGRVRLLREAFPEEAWPDLCFDSLRLTLDEWLAPFLCGVRSGRDLAALDLLPLLKALLGHEKLRLLEERAPSHVTVPSGRRLEIDYASGEEPLLAVKLQEMFGLADTPAIAGGRVKLLLHLLSPAGRPVQVTRDLRNFWESGYREVKRELKGRYPKHPWPDDPWKAEPTRKTKRALQSSPR
ncbi:ATP-dependent helicase HrpB, partial [bacterium]|nr:ATP-dependent helicase HrpB [bacterium]